MTPCRFICALLACAALAAASLHLADEPVYDAWAWLVWGRELTQLGLDTTSGPSWKPLPVLLAAPLSLTGGAAPELWLVLVRTAFLLSFVLAADLAHLLTAGRPHALRLAAAGFAIAVLALLSDDTTPWSRQAAGGMSEPLLVALVLGAVRAALGGHARLALVLGALAALVRPEAWPLLALYGAWCWRRDPRTRQLVVVLALGVPALWLVPELFGSGGGGAGRAQRATGDPRETLERAFALPLAVAWPLALAALLRSRVARVLAAGALGWIAIVAAMTLIDFPGLSRFMAPPAAIVGVLGGVGLATLLADLRARRAAGPAALALAVAASLALIVTVPALGDRASQLAQGWRSSARIAQSHDRLRALVDSAGG
ncbi:MAG: hypothetical protein KY433_09250, partial [Actinobacteria bacterium]|nr:hypothetical protein [Actinomycetota bacterium]